MTLGLMNFVGLLSCISRQITKAGGAEELLPIGYYLENTSVRLIPVTRMLVLHMYNAKGREKLASAFSTRN